MGVRLGIGSSFVLPQYALFFGGCKGAKLVEGEEECRAKDAKKARVAGMTNEPMANSQSYGRTAW
jgi:hypothetical protein